MNTKTQKEEAGEKMKIWCYVGRDRTNNPNGWALLEGEEYKQYNKQHPYNKEN